MFAFTRSSGASVIVVIVVFVVVVVVVVVVGGGGGGGGGGGATAAAATAGSGTAQRSLRHPSTTVIYSYLCCFMTADKAPRILKFSLSIALKLELSFAVFKEEKKACEGQDNGVID